MRSAISNISTLLRNEDGQGITEYGGILAFVALLIALVFTFAQGNLAFALSQSMSTLIGEFNRLNIGVSALVGT